MTNAIPQSVIKIAGSENYVKNSELPKMAFDWISEKFEDNPDRLNHSIRVGEKMQVLSEAYNLPDIDNAVAIGYLHDVGHVYHITGHIFIDAALTMNETVFDQLSPYVAWHSSSVFEATERALVIDFPQPENNLLRELLWVADFTTDKYGEDCSLSEKLNEIKDAGYDSIINRSVELAIPDLMKVFEKHSI